MVTFMGQTVLMSIVIGSFLVTNAQKCDDTLANPTQFLSGVELRIALYSGELSNCTATATNNRCAAYEELTQADNAIDKIWTGYDIELMERLAQDGNFTYVIVSMGSATEISSSVGYTPLARQMLGLDVAPDPSFVPVDIIGQGTWRTNPDRTQWAIWTSPTVSEDVWLVTNGPQAMAPSTLERVLLIFSPFEWSVWFLLFGTLVMCSIIFSIAAHKWKGTKDEITFCGIFYHMAVNCAGKASINLNKAHLKGITIGWVFFIFIIAEVYVANLTAILSKPQEFTPSYSSIDEIVGSHASFCVQKNAANDAYFSNSPKWKDLLQYSLNESYRMSSVPEQINSVVNGFCDSAEVTREDYYIWQADHPDSACVPTLSSFKLTKRARGMMSRTNNTCAVFGINALYQALTVSSCNISAETDELCDALEYHQKHFPVRECIDVIQQASAVKPLQVIDIAGAYVFLFSMFVIGLIASIVGTANRKYHFPCLSNTMESGSATLARELEKMKEQEASRRVIENIRRDHDRATRRSSRKKVIGLLNLVQMNSLDHPEMPNSNSQQRNSLGAINEEENKPTDVPRIMLVADTKFFTRNNDYKGFGFEI